MRNQSCLLIGLLLLSGFGCAAPPKKEQVNHIVLNKTTDAEISKTFGKPRSSTKMVKGAETDLLIEYADSSTAEAGPFAWGNYYWLHIESVNGVVVGYLFARTDFDPTHFDATKLDQIVKGVTTRAELIALMGEPAGMAKPRSRIPSFERLGDEQTGDILAWVNAETTQGGLVRKDGDFKLLVVELDDAGKVKHKLLTTESIRMH